MFNVRKSLVIAITVVMMLAMVVPAAMAAPEVLHGISVDGPVTGTPAYVNFLSEDDLAVEFTVQIDLSQVDDVLVWAGVVNAYNAVFPTDTGVLANEDLNDGIVSYPTKTLTPLEFAVADLQSLPDGWYDLKVCAAEADAPPETWLWCDTEKNAILVDQTFPNVWLDKPGEIWPQRDPAKAIWLTGEEYLVGGAKDAQGVDGESAIFQYCAISNYWTSADGTKWNCGPLDNSWITAAAGGVTAVLNEFGGTEFSGKWETTKVPDDEGVVRICVSDVAGNMSCARSQVFIDNEFTISLRPGWNLISTPTMLFDKDIEDVLHHLLVMNKIDAVYAYDKCSGCGWKSYIPGPAPDSLSTIDYGKGYWVNMIGEGELTFWGTWKNVGNVAPPALVVNEGWNLIGYMHWGRPTAFFPPSESDDYLDNLSIQALYEYNATTGVYYAVYDGQHMRLGAGYWLATDEDGGVIRP